MEETRRDLEALAESLGLRFEPSDESLQRDVRQIAAEITERIIELFGAHLREADIPLLEELRNRVVVVCNFQEAYRNFLATWGIFFREELLDDRQVTYGLSPKIDPPSVILAEEIYNLARCERAHIIAHEILQHLHRGELPYILMEAATDNLALKILPSPHQPWLRLGRKYRWAYKAWRLAMLTSGEEVACQCYLGTEGEARNSRLFRVMRDKLGWLLWFNRWDFFVENIDSDFWWLACLLLWPELRKVTFQD